MRLVWKVENREDYHPPSLYHPHGVVFTEDDDTVIVAEGFWPYSRVQTFTAAKGRSKQTFGQGLILPFDLAVDKVEQKIVVTDHKDRTVKFISTEGTDDIRSWSQGLFEWPMGIAIDDRHLFYITDWARGYVSIHDASGRVIRHIKTSCDEITTFSCPVDIAIDSHHRIIVTDAYDRCVKIFDEEGNLIGKSTGSCIGNGHLESHGTLSDPRGVCIDRCGVAFVVADPGSGSVKQFDGDARWIKDILCTADDEIQNPWGVAVKSDGQLALTEHKLRASPALKLFSRF